MIKHKFWIRDNSRGLNACSLDGLLVNFISGIRQGVYINIGSLILYNPKYV